MGLIVLCFADAGSRVSMTGGPYAYVEVAFGPFAGFVCGVLLWAVGTFALAAVSTVLAASIGALFPALAGPAPRAIILLVAFGLLAALNVRGVRGASRFNNVATVAKLLPLLLLVAVGIFAIRPENLAWQATPGIGDVAGASIVLIFAFAGVESALLPSGEVKNPERTVPRAVLLAMVGITLLYILIHLVAQGVLGEALRGNETPLADAAGRVMGPAGRTLMLVGAIISTFGYVSGMTLAVPRALFAMGRDGFLPGALASVHPTGKTPHVAIWIQAAITCALAITSQFGRLAILANVATLLVYAACCAAAWELRRRGVTGGDIAFKVPGMAVVPWLALAVIAYMLVPITLTEWLVMAGVVAGATVIFFVTQGSRAARVKETQSA
jgi:basic amino acid/polyamine antiporter, APA family